MFSPFSTFMPSLYPFYIKSLKMILENINKKKINQRYVNTCNTTKHRCNHHNNFIHTHKHTKTHTYPQIEIFCQQQTTKKKNRFSSGDLSSEHDDVDPSQLPPAARPIQDQPTKPPISSGGPPVMPPPPAPGVPPAGGAAGAPGAPELSLSFGGGKTAAPAPPRGVSAPTSPAKSRESLLQRVQSLTGAARDQGASILGKLIFTLTFCLY